MSFVVNILEGFLGDCRKHNEDTGQVSFDCPACSEDKGMPEGDGKGNLEINYYKDVFRCWACKDTNDMYGGVSRLIKRYGNLKILADYRLLQPEKQWNGKELELKLLALPEGYRRLTDCSSRDFKYNRAMWYLEDRGVTPEIIEKFKIGYTTAGQFFNRIIIPSYNADGILNYFIARWFDKQRNKYKYINPEASKQEIIFNERYINWDATIYLVEGAFDHIVVPNSIPLLGKDLSNILFYELHEKAKANIVVLLDEDAYDRAQDLYWELNVGRLTDRIRICRLPTGHDPSSIFKEWGAKGIVNYLQKPIKLKQTVLY